jgi:uncharacterized repeat protein (TIGR01451 family)
VLLSLILVVTAAALPAFADGTVGDFEIDGDSIDQGGNSFIDWSTPPPNLAPIPDTFKSQQDDSFGQGSKELEPGGWVCTTGGVPGKDDLKSGKIAIRNVGGDQFIYANWLRFATNGDAHIDYEFNQSSQQGPCLGTLKRTNNDRLITFDTANGGKTIKVRAWRWDFAPGSTTSGIFTEITGTAEHVTFDGAVNIAPSKSDPGVPAGGFGELSLNLTQTIGTITCGEFAGVHMKTRASSEINSALKDRTVAVPVPGINCPRPDLHIAKTGVQNADGTITFTITYSNSGNGEATSATISDTLPPGTSFNSCNPSCTQSGNTVTWSVGPIPPNSGNRTVTLTLNITQFPSSCQITNVASISSPQFNAGVPVSSTPFVLTVNPAPNPAGAHANGNATGIFASAPGLITDQTIGTSASSQSGVGSPPADDDTFLNVNEAAPVVTATVINTHAKSTVAASGAVQESSAETLNVNVLSGIVKASKVLGIAKTVATGSSATYGTATDLASSGFSDLVVDGDGPGGNDPVAMNNVAPNTSIDVSAAFGSGSYIRLFWLSNNQSGLAAGTYSADVRVRMIDVHLVHRIPFDPTSQPADAVVSQAVAHSDFPATPVCVARPVQTVAADATIGRVTRLVLDPTIVGYVFIPSTGGTSSEHLNNATIETPPPSGTVVLTSGAADSFATGALNAANTTASAYAVLKNACVLPSGTTCAVSATLVKGAAKSTANATSTSSGPEDTQLLGLKVGGVFLDDAVISPNTAVVVPGVGTVWLKREFCNGATTPIPCSSGGPGTTTMLVRAIEVVITATGIPGLPPGTIIVVAEAHTSATYIP